MGGLLSCGGSCANMHATTDAVVVVVVVCNDDSKSGGEDTDNTNITPVVRFLENDNGNNNNNDNNYYDNDNDNDDDDDNDNDTFFSAKEALSEEMTIPHNNNHNNNHNHDHNTLYIPESLLLSKLSAVKTTDSTTTTTRSDQQIFVAVVEDGYPGKLTKEQINACIQFRRQLFDPKIDSTYRIMVYLNVNINHNHDNNHDNNDDNHDNNHDNHDNHIDEDGNVDNNNNNSGIGNGPEDEEYALCRYLRARQFNIQNTFIMMDSYINLFKTSLIENNLWRTLKDVEYHINCPLSIFRKQFPIITYGISKKGSFIVYMKIGLIKLDNGLDCINNAKTGTDFINQYLPIAWWFLCYKFNNVMYRIQQKNEQQQHGDKKVVLAETIIIVDLSGLKRSFFTSRTLEFMKHVFSIIRCFPEILNCVIVINVPTFFNILWYTIIKHFVDINTVQKIKFFSSIQHAKDTLLQLIDSNQLLKEYGGININTYNNILTKQILQESSNEYNNLIIEWYNNKQHHQYQHHQHHSNDDNDDDNDDDEYAKKTTSLRTFELKDNETAILTVYTQAKLHHHHGDVDVDVNVNVKDGNNITTTTSTIFLLLSSSSTSSNDKDIDNDNDNDNNDSRRRNDNDTKAIAVQTTVATTSILNDSIGTNNNNTNNSSINDNDNDNGNGNDNSNSNDNRGLFGQPAATTIENSIVHGPGTFELVATAAVLPLSLSSSSSSSSSSSLSLFNSKANKNKPIGGGVGGGVEEKEHYLLVVSIK